MLSGTYVPNILASYLLQFNMWMKWMVDYVNYLVWVLFSCRDLCKQPILIRAGGGIYNYLYQLRSLSDEAGQTKSEGSSILGKFQITWRTNLGEPGRLQTQNIHSTVSEVLASDLIILFCVNLSVLSYCDIEPKVISFRSFITELFPLHLIFATPFLAANCKQRCWSTCCESSTYHICGKTIHGKNPDWHFF